MVFKLPFSVKFFIKFKEKTSETRHEVFADYGSRATSHWALLNYRELPEILTRWRTV